MSAPKQSGTGSNVKKYLPVSSKIPVCGREVLTDGRAATNDKHIDFLVKSNVYTNVRRTHTMCRHAHAYRTRLDPCASIQYISGFRFTYLHTIIRSYRPTCTIMHIFKFAYVCMLLNIYINIRRGHCSARDKRVARPSLTFAQVEVSRSQVTR